MVNIRYTIPIALIFILVAGLFSPALAYTIGDDICSGLETQGEFQYRFLNETEINNDIYIYFYNETGDFPYTEWEVVDNSYNANIEDSAIHFFEFDGTGVLDNVDNERFYLNWRNDTTPILNDFADMNTFCIDLYNVSFTGIPYLYIITDFQYINETEDKVYFSRFTSNPVTDLTLLVTGDHKICGIVDGLCDVRNYTTGESIEEGVSCPNPMPIHSVDLTIFNVNAESMETEDWSIEFTIDNFNTTYEESEYNSPDCAVEYSQISDIPQYNHYVKFSGVDSNTQAGRYEYTKWLMSVAPALYNGSHLITDGSGVDVRVPMSFVETFNNSGLSPEILVGNEIDLTCYLLWLDYQIPTYPECQNAIITGYRDVDMSDYRNKAIVGYFSSNILSDSYVVDRVSKYSITDIYYRTKYNDTHLMTYYPMTDITEIEDKYYLTGFGGYGSQDQVDYAWDLLGNFSYWNYQVNSPDWTHTSIFYSKERAVDFERNSGVKEAIFSGDYVRGAYFGGEYHTQFWRSELDGSLSFASVLDDGICSGWDSGSKIWRFDNACLPDVGLPDPFGVTGFAVSQQPIDPIGNFFGWLYGIFGGVGQWIRNLFGLA